MFKRIFLEQPYGRSNYFKCVHMLTRERGGWNIGPKTRAYQINGRPQTNIVEYFLCIGMAKYTKAWKISLFSSIIITIILSYAIIRIYTILHIYLRVSEIEGVVDLYWVIGRSALEKINSIYFQGISLLFSRMFF